MFKRITIVGNMQRPFDELYAERLDGVIGVWRATKYCFVIMLAVFTGLWIFWR